LDIESVATLTEEVESKTFQYFIGPI